MFKNILLAYDGSECAEHASVIAQEMATKFGSLVLVLYAFHPVPRRWGDALAEKTVVEETMQGHVVIGGVVNRLKEAGIACEGEVVEGMAHEAIVKTARAREMDLIIIGSQGLGERTSYMLGTVSDKVVHRAFCPVLVVR